MPSLKEIKGRIASVNSTRKITSAMKMVASSKLHHAQQMIENMLPYSDMLEHILKSFLAADVDARSEYLLERPVRRVALVVYSSNSSMCGGFNTNVVKMLQQAVKEYGHLGVENIEVYPIGRKVAEQVKKMGLLSMGNYASLVDKPNVNDCIGIVRQLGRKFIGGEIDKVELIYHHFKSVGSQVLTRKVFLPLDLSAELMRNKERDLVTNVATAKALEYMRNKSVEETAAKGQNEVKPLNDNFIVEPSLDVVMKELIPKYANLLVYTALLDSCASEHAARMVAMQTATDNADELLRELNLQYNKGRQQAITSELLDIVGGSVAD